MAAGGGGAAVENAELGNWAGDLGRRLEKDKGVELQRVLHIFGTVEHPLLSSF